MDGSSIVVGVAMAIAREALKDMNFRDVSSGRRLAPVHPGAVLLEDFITPMGITRYRVARQTSMQQRRVDEICAGTRSITADTALRLAKLFGTDAAFWMNLQAQYDLEVAERELHDRIETEVIPLPIAA
jgi:addiction module HigA family antidote